MKNSKDMMWCPIKDHLKFSFYCFRATIHYLSFYKHCFKTALNKIFYLRRPTKETKNLKFVISKQHDLRYFWIKRFNKKTLLVLNKYFVTTKRITYFFNFNRSLIVE